MLAFCTANHASGAKRRPTGWVYADQRSQERSEAQVEVSSSSSDSGSDFRIPSQNCPCFASKREIDKKLKICNCLSPYDLKAKSGWYSCYRTGISAVGHGIESGRIFSSSQQCEHPLHHLYFR
ncbi:hypothetical protein AVEN_203644-1 [Araneus ventricosus]|uniref:Uncharacterized protein n=1 Tax=Araneus ventricosus TaxID=182803 RepID=A0A4Y2RPA4_ARAVE|nr:hypothetical protein AVEN_203644-1 [Araneus ventricosus]